MADPRTELADIIVPAAPEVVATGGNPLLWLAVAMACAAGIALAAWLWRRRRPVRGLRQVATAVEQQQETVPALATRLDVWARMRYQLPRVDSAQCPSGIDPVAWSGWVKALQQLRFAPPSPAGYAALAALCDTARTWERHV